MEHKEIEEHKSNKVQFENQKLRFLIEQARQEWTLYGSERAIEELVYRYSRLDDKKIKEYMLTKENLLEKIMVLFSIKKIGKLIWIKESKER